jgi:AbrB family looped-hinge helix DNA binding protein
VLTAKISTKGQIVVPLELRRKGDVKAGDAFEFIEGDEPNVIIMRKIARRANEGLVDALLACPHAFDIPRARGEVPKKPKL